MCGIAGILGQQAVDRRRRRVEKMTSALVHRGPDDEGYFDDDVVTLGFRRLAVIDLETGQQPITLPDRKLAIVLNGEIYNFRELREELRTKGHRFRSAGDVEVVLRLWAEEGPDCLQRLNGMFALAVWDGEARRLYLARDRFGIKPLYLCGEAGSLAFASELRALRAGGFPRSPRLDPVQLRHYLAYGFLSPQGAPLTGVRSLAPATILEADTDGGERVRSYWVPPDSENGASTREGLMEGLRAAMEGAVERQLVADVPVGVFLSGGLDSSTLCALANDRVSGPLRTFSVGFEGAGAVSELPFAREVAGFLGSEHHELMMDPETVAADLETIVDGLDAPLADPTAIPTWYMSKLARERVTVALSGEGADEIFGGYARQRFDVGIDKIGALGRLLLPAALRITGRKTSRRFLRRLEMEPGLQRQLDWGRVVSVEEMDNLVLRSTATDEAIHAPYGDLAERWLDLAATDPVNGRLMTDREVFLPADLLPKVDRMSMAHSLEVRVPYLDNQVVDLMLDARGALKQSFRRDKILLREAASAYLPETASRRAKRGFEVPIGEWLRGSLRPVLLDWLEPGTLDRQEVVRSETVSALVDEHLHGVRNHGKTLWALMVLSRWLEASGAR
jgi:asparagine synthase (glutamine-hydrolysing)